MLHNGRATDKLRARPNCDICKASGTNTPAISDAKTKQGPWGYLCDIHFESMAWGLGMGRGQILLCGDNMDRDLVRTYLKDK